MAGKIKSISHKSSAFNVDLKLLKALINEDRLLSRIDYLEKQLAFHSSKAKATDLNQQVSLAWLE